MAGISITEKHCRKCDQTKSSSEFTIGKAVCRKCDNARRQQEYRAAYLKKTIQAALNDPNAKTCNKCQITKSCSAFYSPHGFYQQESSRCRSCSVRWGTLDKASKFCWRCKAVKPCSEFSRDTDRYDSLSSVCRICAREQAKKYWVHTGMERARWEDIRKNFGLSRTEYEALWNAQRGCCAICLRHQNEFPRYLAVDHDHQTNTIRGLLCSSCNVAIGLLGEDTTRLLNAIKYLKEQKT